MTTATKSRRNGTTSNHDLTRAIVKVLCEKLSARRARLNGLGEWLYLDRLGIWHHVSDSVLESARRIALAEIQAGSLPRPRGSIKVQGLKSGAAVVPPKKAPKRTTYSGRLGERIRTTREAADLAVEEVARQMRQRGYEVSTATLYHWENGTAQPNLDALPTLAKVLKVQLLDLFPPQ